MTSRSEFLGELRDVRSELCERLIEQFVHELCVASVTVPEAGLVMAGFAKGVALQFDLTPDEWREVAAWASERMQVSPRADAERNQS